jgi:transcriptional regulator with XRE-family HTH domain
VAARRSRLAGRRKALGYTQEFLAEQLDVDRTTVGRWERGETDPFPYLRHKLCQVLKVPPGELDSLLNPAPDGRAPSARPGPDATGHELFRTESLETTDGMYWKAWPAVSRSTPTRPSAQYAHSPVVQHLSSQAHRRWQLSALCPRHVSASPRRRLTQLRGASPPKREWLYPARTQDERSSIVRTARAFVNDAVAEVGREPG